MWKFRSWKEKDKCLFLIVAGMILCILAFPSERVSGKRIGKRSAAAAEVPAISSEEQVQETGISAKTTYESVLEQRVKEVLKNVEGVGTVDVLIVLKASAEKVVQTDQNYSRTVSQETDSSGGTRNTESEEQEYTAVFTGTDSGKSPVIQKELYPEISGIVISASGGGNPTICAEITKAMEALFGLEAHKIKVLKRISS